jgi:hypothetical protein
MRTGRDRRFPVHELYVVAAMLDSSQRQLRSVQHYLLENGITAVDLLSKYKDIYVGDDQTEIEQVEVTRVSFQEEEIPWKKKKFESLCKHSSVDIDQTREIQQYRCLSVPTDGPLKW